MKTFTQTILLATTLFTTNAEAQYCMLPGRTPYDSDQPGITEFKLNTIDRTSSNVENTSAVVVETGDSTVLLQGHTYTVSITHSKDINLFPDARNNIRVWIDYNGNKDFTDANETVITKDYDSAGTFTASFTVPATAPLGATRLRATAKMSSDAGHTIPTPCDNPADPIGYHGEMEDYVVTIKAPTAVNGINISASTFSIAPNPASTDITISFTSIENNPLSINLYDITGKLLGNLLTESKQSSSNYKFNIAAYTQNAGMYFIKVLSGNEVSYQKLIKMN